MEIIKKVFSKKVDYMINQVVIDLNSEIINLKEEFYFELSKDEVIDYFNKVLMILNKWKNYFNSNDVQKIIDEYKELEGLISELELCLADYEEHFKLNGISYSLFEIGKILNDFNK